MWVWCGVMWSGVVRRGVMWYDVIWGVVLWVWCGANECTTQTTRTLLHYGWIPLVLAIGVFYDPEAAQDGCVSLSLVLFFRCLGFFLFALSFFGSHSLTSACFIFAARNKNHCGELY